MRGLLDETFRVYGSQLGRFWAIVAVIQVPLGAAGLALIEMLGDGVGVRTIAAVAGGLGGLAVYAAAIYGVGQLYLTGSIGIRACYNRVLWRGATLVLVAAVIGLTVALVLLPLLVADRQALAAFSLVLAIPAMALGLYWSMSVQAVVVEGHKAPGGLRRSFELVRGNWWRVFGFSALVFLVTMGLAIVVVIPFEMLSLTTNPGSGLGLALEQLGNVAVELIVLPVVFISGTLLYYDLRVRSEEYDLSTLSREMGLATV